MALATLRRQIRGLRERVDRLTTPATTTPPPWLADPAYLMRAAGMAPDPWQADFLACPARRALLLASRQSGKSQTVACKALHTALASRSLILLLSPSQRQSGELFRSRLLPLWQAAGRPLFATSPTQTELRLSNGSRIVSLPDSEGQIRSFSAVTMLVIDEAARVSDDLYRAVRPMLATSGGTLIGMSTPWGQRGWFHDAWHSPDAWHRVKVTADQCPRISAEFLAEERLALGETWFGQEYGCLFASMVGAEWPADYFAGILFDSLPPDLPRQTRLRVNALDPSKGRDARTGDFAALVDVVLDTAGHLWVDAHLDVMPSDQVEDAAVLLLQQTRPGGLIVEANGFQELVGDNIARKAREKGVACPLYQHVNTTNKTVRIRMSLTPLLAQRRIHIANTKGGRLLLGQLRAFPLADHDDGPDALELATQLINHLLGARPLTPQPTRLKVS